MNPLPPRLTSLAVLALFSLLLAQTQAQVVIAEFMAANTNTTIVDEDGSRSDWLELHNTGTDPVNLNGWYLSDESGDPDPTRLRKWQFPTAAPAITLAPGARLVVWCSGKDRTAAASRLHTNFRLDASGDYLALVRPDGRTIEHAYAPQFPPQAVDVAYGISGGKQWNALIGPTLSSAWKVRVPQSATEFTSITGWNSDPAFADTTWANKGTVISAGAPRGIGYDSAGPSGGRAFLINYSTSPNGVVAGPGDVSGTVTGMYNTGSFPGVPTLCARKTFTVADPASVQQLRFTARYDDGFIVYLNGVEVLRSNAPTTAGWASAAPVDREDDQSEEYETFSLPGAQAHLVAGTNLLAIHGFNEMKNSGHFVLTPILEAFESVAGATGGAAGYLASPTPGAENTIASVTIGPDIGQTTKNPPQPAGGAGSEPLLITARVRQTLNPIGSVTCRYLVNFGGEASIPMLDDGTGADAAANDGIYSAHVPTTALSAGHLLRWRVVAQDTATPANTATDPPFRDPVDNDQYFGTVAQTPSIESRLPVLFWFQNTAANPPLFATNKAGIRANFFFRLPEETSGRYYDNLRVNLHGQSSTGFPKKSQNISLNADNRFTWRIGEKEIRSFNLLSNWADKSKVRNSMMWELWNRTGHPSHWAQSVRVQQVSNGNLAAGVDAQFLGIWDMVEDANEEFLERWGLDENGALYKCYNSLDNTLQNSSTQGAGVEKKTREFEDFKDLAALVNALNPSNALSSRRRWAYDNTDIPALINYLAVHDVFMSHDFGHKNYYVYRDTLGSGEWKLLPWDQDLSLGHTWTSPSNGGSAYFDDHIDSSKGLVIGGTGNRLMRLVLAESGSTELIQMYCRRVKTLVDQYLGPAAAPQTVIESRIAEFLDVLDPPGWPVLTDAERDFQKWGFWVHGSGGRINATDSRAAHYRIRPMAARITTANPSPPYPAANPHQPFGVTSVPALLPGRRAVFFGGNPRLSGQGLPPTQPAVPSLIIESVTFDPGAAGHDQEYFIIRNPNSFAIDLSDWKVTGAIDHTFRPGTVIPAQGTGTSDGGSSAYVNQLVVTRRAQAFRQRTASPKAGEYRHIQDGYQGRLSARGGVIELRDPAGILVKATTYAGAPTDGQNFLRVTELNFAPAAPTAAELTSLPGVQPSDFEFLELINTGTTDLPLGGAQFDRGITFVFPAGFSLAAGQRTVIASNLQAFRVRYGEAVPVAGQFEGNLENAGEEVRLLDPVGEEVLRFTYSPHWYAPATGGGYSLVTRGTSPAFDGYDSPTAWALSGPSGGTPGGADSTVSQSFDGWQHDYFSLVERGNAALAAVSADPEGDGLNNWGEYAFGRHPRESDHSANAVLGEVAVDGVNYLTITFTRRKNAIDVAYAVEAGSHLELPAAWSAITEVTGAPEELGHGLERVTYRDSQPIGEGTRFLRVRAVKR